MENCQGRGCALRRRVWGGIVLLLIGSVVSPALAGDPIHGAHVYANRCAPCHGTKGHSSMPGLPDFSWQGMGNNGLMMPDQRLVSRIALGGRGCPSFAGVLSGQDILDVITHLRSLR